MQTAVKVQNIGASAESVTNKCSNEIYSKKKKKKLLTAANIFWSLYFKDRVDRIFLISADELLQRLSPLYLTALFPISDLTKCEWNPSFCLVLWLWICVFFSQIIGKYSGWNLMSMFSCLRVVFVVEGVNSPNPPGVEYASTLLALLGVSVQCLTFFLQSMTFSTMYNFCIYSLTPLVPLQWQFCRVAVRPNQFPPPCLYLQQNRTVKGDCL